MNLEFDEQDHRVALSGICPKPTTGGLIREPAQELVARRVLPSLFPKLARAMFPSCVRNARAFRVWNDNANEHCILVVEYANAIATALKNSATFSFLFDSLMMGASFGIAQILLALVSPILSLGAAGIGLGIGLWTVITLLDVTGLGAVLDRQTWVLKALLTNYAMLFMANVAAQVGIAFEGPPHQLHEEGRCSL